MHPHEQRLSKSVSTLKSLTVNHFPSFPGFPKSRSADILAEGSAGHTCERCVNLRQAHCHGRSASARSGMLSLCPETDCRSLPKFCQVLYKVIQKVKKCDRLILSLTEEEIGTFVISTIHEEEKRSCLETSKQSTSLIVTRIELCTCRDCGLVSSSLKPQTVYRSSQVVRYVSADPLPFPISFLSVSIS